MSPSTGTFISMDSYQGSIYDPVTLHKYSYTNANPVQYVDPTGYVRQLQETQISQTGMLLIGSALLFSASVSFNIFMTLKKNLLDASVVSQDISVTQRDWESLIIDFPSHNYATEWIMTTVMWLASWHLFKAIYEIEEADGDVDTPGVPDENEKEKEKQDNQSSVEGETEKRKTNLGNEVDITPSKNHSTTTKNPGPNGEPNSSIDIIDDKGNVITRRWYDSNGRAYRDVDMTNHGNSKHHPEWPHEHIWDWSNGFPCRK